MMSTIRVIASVCAAFLSMLGAKLAQAEINDDAVTTGNQSSVSPNGIAKENIRETDLPDRIGVVIGINNYRNSNRLSLTKLNAAENDARAVADSMQLAGFKNIIRLISDDDRYYIEKNDILKALNELDGLSMDIQRQGRRPPIVVFYYAGHGFSHNNEDFIVPSNFEPSYSEDVPEMGIKIRDIANRLSWSNPALKILIVDACRNPLEHILESRAEKERTSAAKPGHFGSITIRPENSRGLNDTYYIYSTIEGKLSYEDTQGDTEAKGRFTGAFVNALRDAEKASREKKTGVSSSLDAITSSVYVAMGGNKRAQRLTVRKDSTSFAFYPTSEDYNAESRQWKAVLSVNSLGLNADSPDFLDELMQRRFCNIQTFLQTYSYYSYFSYLAIKKIEQMKFDTWPDCKNIDTVNLLASDTASRTLKTSEGWVTAPANAPAPGSVVSRVRIGDLKSNSVIISKDGLGNFSDDIGVEELAVAKKVSSVLSSKAEGAKKLARVESNSLVEIVGVENSKLLKVRTEKGVVGFVESSDFDELKSVVSFAINGSHRDPFVALRAIGKSSLIIDAQIRYRIDSGEVGTRLAQMAIAEILNLTRELPREKLSFVPRVVAIGDEKVEVGGRKEKMSASEPVEVIISLVPLASVVRGHLPSIGGRQADVSQAADGQLVLELSKDELLNRLLRISGGAPEPEIAAAVKLVQDGYISDAELRLFALERTYEKNRQRNRESTRRTIRTLSENGVPAGGVLKKSALWKKAVIKACFMNPPSDLSAYIARVARIWSLYGNIDFDFGSLLTTRECTGDRDTSDIRISLERGLGNWSYLGTDALMASLSSATLNIDPSSVTMDGSSDGFILHEFGHVLALQHIYDHPDSRCGEYIDIDKLMKKYNFSRAASMSIFPARGNASVGGLIGVYDKRSVMQFHLSADIVKPEHKNNSSALSECFSSLPNRPSELDKMAIYRAYPDTRLADSK